MKVAIIGDCNSIFIKQYIEYVLLNDEVVLLAENSVNSHYRLFYERHNIKVLPLYGGMRKWMRGIPFFRSRVAAFFWSKAAIRFMKHFDCVHIHALNQLRGYLGECLRKKTDNLIISIWGSELLGRNTKYLKSLTPYYGMANHITLESEKMIDTFKQVYGSAFNGKLTKTVLFLGIFDYMDVISHQSGPKELCDFFNIKSYDKWKVFVGHNGREVQRHFAITDELEKLPQEIKDKIVLVYTMTYGCPDSSYLMSLKEKANNSGCESVFIEDYLTEEGIAKLRLICDILIHAQPTDAASASVRECLYGGSIVVNGDWLRYDFIPDYEKRLIEYSDLKEVPGIITDIISNNEKYQTMRQYNKGNRDGAPSSIEISEAWRKLIIS